MDLQEVDVGSSEADKGGVDGCVDGLTGEAFNMRSVAAERELEIGELWKKSGYFERLGVFLPSGSSFGKLPIHEARVWGDHTKLIDIVLADRDVFQKERGPQAGIFRDDTEAFGKDHDFMSRNLIFLQCSSNDLLGFSVGVIVRRIPLISTSNQTNSAIELTGCIPY